jgi:beta-glucosidase
MSVTTIEKQNNNSMTTAQKVEELISKMLLHEKIGQMSQFSGHHGHIPYHLAEDIRAGNVGSVLNEVKLETVNELQRLAVEESRLGIPLLIGRDVIHGFKTIFPIPLGQAATWSEQCVEDAARISAIEAASSGVNWTFAPMIDITRDPRWGRIAESLGEDPYLCSQLGASMITGFQGESLDHNYSIASCAKHFAGYGASESGRDYHTVNLSEHDLRNVFMPPFKMAVESGAATFMSAFSDLNGVPATGNHWLMKTVLRDEWNFQGFVVSDWDSIHQLSVHGFTENDCESAHEACQAGVDMEMVSTTYSDHLSSLLENERVSIEQINESVRKILTLKFELGLFDAVYVNSTDYPIVVNEKHLQVAKLVATKSCVLLKNENDCLPINQHKMKSIGVLGPLADDGYEQLGTWIFDGEEQHSITCLSALRKAVDEDVEIEFVKSLETSRSVQQDQFSKAIELAQRSDLVIMVMGEESILSGEAHCRSEINLPGAQENLINAIHETGKPIILVILAGRPLTLGSIIDKVDGILYAWHPGTMGGPAIADILLGKIAPSGKLPVTFPRSVGQIPIYYAQKHSGKPASDDTYVHMNEIPTRAPQTSLGMTSAHLDTHFSPLFPFGYGLTFGEVEYADIQVDKQTITIGETICVDATVTNSGKYEIEEVAQLYIRDLVANVTRPIKELKGFKRITLGPNESKNISFELHTDQLAFYDRTMNLRTEKGQFHVWIGGSSDTNLFTKFDIN